MSSHFERSPWPDTRSDPRSDPAVAVPAPSTRNWSDVEHYALQFDGYAAIGGFDACGDLANAVAHSFATTGALPRDKAHLRACLFFEARRWRHFGSEPDEQTWSYIKAILQMLHAGAAEAMSEREKDTSSREAEYRRSSFYEQLVEHVFVSELLQEAWFRHGETVEVLRSEIDASGFDLVLECRGIMRHVQLKTSRTDARTGSQKVSLGLAAKPSGCVIWIVRMEDPERCRIALEYLFFGGEPGQPLPDISGFKTARHTKPDAAGVKKERLGLRVVPKNKFERIGTQQLLLGRLFGL